MKRSKEMAIYMRPAVEIVNGKFVRSTIPQEVRVLTRAEGWAMVRVKGGLTFAVLEKELTAPGLAAGKAT